MKNTVLVIMVIALLGSCRKEVTDVAQGPDLNDLFGPFEILTEITPNQSVVNFTDGQEIFWSGELSKNTDWIIRLEGQNSGAVRTITGSSRLISITNSQWLGGANTFPGFALENASYEIIFPNEEDAPTLTGEISITGLKVDDGYLVTSFEDGIGSNWTEWSQTTVTGSIECGNNISASGDCAYKIAGTVSWNWGIGFVNIRPESGDFELPASASNLYFNMGLKALENVGPTSSFIEFTFDEDDNQDGVFDPATEDRIVYQYWTKDTEWDLISLKYEDLKIGPDGTQAETNGNGLMEPSKLFSINVFYLADPAGGESGAIVDHLIFTTDEPYRP